MRNDLIFFWKLLLGYKPYQFLEIDGDSWTYFNLCLKKDDDIWLYRKTHPGSLSTYNNFWNFFYDLSVNYDEDIRYIP